MSGSIFEAALRSLLIALIVWVGLRALRVRNVLTQKAAWGMVLASALALPLLMPLIASRQWLPSRAALTLPVESWLSLAESFMDTQKSTGAATAKPLAVSLPTPAGLPASPSIATRPSGAAGRLTIAPVKLFFLLYLAVSGGLLFRLILGLFSVVRLWLNAEPIAIETNSSSAAGLRVRSSSEVSAPVTIGSGILLPADFARWDAAKLRVVLAHEGSHIRQGDFYLQLLAGLYSAIVWFSPLGWWLKRKLSALSEAISDRAGLEQASSASSYAQILLEFAALPHPTPIGVAMARTGNLSHRIESLLNESSFRQAFTGTRRRALLAVLLVPIALFVTTAFLRVDAATPQSAVQPVLPNAALPVPAPAQTANPEPPAVPSSSEAAAPAQSVLALKQQQVASAEPKPARGPFFPASERQDSYALISPDREGIRFSGTWDDLTRWQIETARKQVKREFLWFTRSNKIYIVDDPTAIAQIEPLYKHYVDIADKQQELGRAQQQFSHQMERLSKASQESINAGPTLDDAMASAEFQIAKLRFLQGQTFTAQQWQELESKLSNLQDKLAGTQGRIGDNFARLGTLQGELGGLQGQIGGDEAITDREIDQNVASVIEQSLRSGKARPVQ